MNIIKYLKPALCAASLVLIAWQCTDNPKEPSSTEAERKIVFSSNRAGNFDLYMMNEDGSNIERLTSDPDTEYMPAVSPNGKMIAYSNMNDIFIFDNETNEIKQITFNGKANRAPEWSPDGSMIAYYASHISEENIYIMNLNENKEEIVHNHKGVTQISWSPDGKKLLYSVHSTITSIFVLGLETGISEEVINDAIAGCWNNEGTLITYISVPDYKIVTFNTETQAKNILLEGVHVFNFDWSSDGNSIVYTTMGGPDPAHEYTEIHVFYRNESKTVRLTNDKYYEYSPGWIYVNRGQEG